MLEVVLTIATWLIIFDNLRLRYRLRTPKLEYDCARDRHMWGQIERVSGGTRQWMQGRTCQLCSLEHVLGTSGKWGPSIGSVRM